MLRSRPSVDRGMALVLSPLSVWDHSINKMQIGLEATRTSYRHSGRPHRCFQVIRDAPRPPWSDTKCSQTLQEHSQVLLKAPAVLEVNSGCYEIWLIGYSKFGVAETSAQVCGDFESSLRPLGNSAGDLVPYSHSNGSQGSITTRHFVYQIRLCYNPNIRYIILWHVLCI
jgi:hypothetical protein